MATDAVGHREPAPAQPDAWTGVVTAPPETVAATLADGALILDIEHMVPGRTFTIERSATLPATQWQSALSFEGTATGVQASIPLDPERTAMFFRVW